MATTVPPGDPGLSQNAGQAQLQWQNRPQRTVQFAGMDDATAAAGAAPNPNAPPPAPPAQQETNPPPSNREDREEPRRPSSSLGGMSSGQLQFLRSHNFTPQQYPGYVRRQQQGGFGGGFGQNFAGGFNQLFSGLRNVFGGPPGAPPAPVPAPAAAPANLQPPPGFVPGQRPSNEFTTDPAPPVGLASAGPGGFGAPPVKMTADPAITNYGGGNGGGNSNGQDPDRFAKRYFSERENSGLT